MYTVAGGGGESHKPRQLLEDWRSLINSWPSCNSISSSILFVKKFYCPRALNVEDISAYSALRIETKLLPQRHIFPLQPHTTRSGRLSVTMNNSRVGWVAEPEGRGTAGLLYSCLFTIFLSTWTAYHPGVEIVQYKAFKDKVGDLTPFPKLGRY
jgi:hypothetical protein